MSINPKQTKRGDTLIEVMFSIAVFSLIAVLSIVMMNAGVASGERSLELVTARQELNAQAEALRFIHSSYVSELTLPICDSTTTLSGEKCQQFRSLWKSIVNNARDPANPADPSDPDAYSIPYPLDSCNEVYKDDNALLVKNHAFVLNTRQIYMLNDSLSTSANPIYISAVGSSTANLFQPAPLGARIVYVKNSTTYTEDSGDSSVDVLSTDPLLYRKVGQVEGIWVVAVRDSDNRYYDFYIEACWYGSNSKAPTSLDAVIRLYNPEGI